MAVNFKTETLVKHKDLSDKIKAGLVSEGSVIKETESHATYFENLPEGIEKKQVEDLAKYNQNYVTAAHVAVGETAADMFKSDKDLQRVDAKLGFFGKRDTVEMTVHREKTFRNNFAEKEEDRELKKHLVVNTTVSQYGHGLKSVRDAMSEEFKNSFVK